MSIRLTKSGPSQHANPQLKFANRKDVQTLVSLLAEHRGHPRDRDRMMCVFYGSIIYDHFSDALTKAKGQKWGNRTAWLELAKHKTVQQILRSLLDTHDEGEKIGDVVLTLPMASRSQIHSGKQAPKGLLQGTYLVRDLTSEQLIEVAYMLRCNVFHGSSDPNENNTSRSLRNVAKYMTHLVWEMVAHAAP
jgi:hypothetical protein